MEMNRDQAQAIWTCTRERSAFCLETSSRQAIWMTFHSRMFKFRIWRWKASIFSLDPDPTHPLVVYILGQATSVDDLHVHGTLTPLAVVPHILHGTS